MHSHKLIAIECSVAHFFFVLCRINNSEKCAELKINCFLSRTIIDECSLCNMHVYLAADI